MKRLRHPIRAIREPFGTAGLIVAMIALIAALGGSALAANGALSGKQKKEVEKIAKKFSGKPGATGASGPAGKDGANGSNGAPGSDGTAGTAGKNGTNGSPWTAGGVLPSGSTETGAWIETMAPEGPEMFAPISFTVPLAAGLDPAHTLWDKKAEEEGNEAEFDEKCPGTTEAPAASRGYLCVYTSVANNAAPHEISLPGSVSTSGAGTSGALIRLSRTDPTTTSIAGGSWAVTAP